MEVYDRIETHVVDVVRITVPIIAFGSLGKAMPSIFTNLGWVPCIM